MKLNSNIKLVGKNIILVPYNIYHVAKYHEWMKSENLQKLTASEPLTLEEEYNMQNSWRDDEYKCTFIIIDKKMFENSSDEIAWVILIRAPSSWASVTRTTRPEDGAWKALKLLDTLQILIIKSMIGDTNIFIDKESSLGEIEIMIAEESARGKKFGWEAVILMLLYGILYIKLKSYEAKISLENDISIKMFKKLGFEETSRSEVFQEVTLSKEVTTEWLDWLQTNFSLNVREHSLPNK